MFVGTRRDDRLGRSVAKGRHASHRHIRSIQRYVLSCGLLLVPASTWNIALTERLPSSFASAESWRDIPAPLALTENSYELLCSSFRSFMPLTFAAPGRMRASFIFVAGNLVYFASWLMLTLFPPRRGQRVL